MTARPEGPVGSEDTLLATDPDPASERGATVGATLDLPSHEPAHREAAPNVLRPRAAGERYRLGIELGRGGMGRVVEAFDVQLGRTVALKEVLPQITGTPRRFAREVQITARLEHPAIVPLYDAGIGTDGRPFYVMRRVSGRPLDELLARAKRLDERLVLLPAVLAAIDAIAHAHKRGVIHRDLKPANILVGDLGETVVIDWGLAKVIGEEDVVEGAAQLSAGDSLQTQYGSVFGTPGFMSPEQARGEEQGTEGDVYALGACLYQLLAGKPPHAGKSATELLASTHQHKVLPLDEVAPNAPAELVAIVEKALRFDADQRYPNAEKLGEDVRRFSTGQLVKAHRYSRRERLARFARKHRGALGVAAVAMVTLAILAWVGVTRIVAERNAATDARDDARVLQAEAEAARDREADRAEAMIVARARALVETNPTEAIAVLKQIATSTKHAGEIRAIAKSAAVRGIAWAFDGPAEMTISLEMSPDGTRLAQGTRAGSVYVWDLVRRKLVIAKTFPANVHVRWVAHGEQLLVTTPTQTPVLFDPATGQGTAFGGRPCGYVEASLAGDRAIGIDDQHHAVVYDVAARTATTLEPTREVTDVRMPPDGAWVALIDRREVRAVDLATGKQLARFDQAPPTVVAVTSNRLAVSTGKEVWELTLGPQQAWAPVPIQERQLIVSMVYVGTVRQLLVLSSPTAISTWNGTRIAWSTETTDLQLALVTPAHGMLLLPTTRGDVTYRRDDLTGSFRLPQQLTHPRLAARYDGSAVAVAGDGIILVYDLSVLVPDVTPTPTNGMYFVDEDTMLIAGMDPRWAWLDLASKTSASVDVMGHGALFVSSIDPRTGRVLAQGPDELVLVRKHQAKVEVVLEGRDPIGRVIPGGPIVAGLADGRVMLADDGKPAREVVKVDGSVVGIGTDDQGYYTAIGQRGELVRGKIATGEIARIRVTPAPSMVVSSDGPRTPFALGDRLFLWTDTRTDELVKFEAAVVSIGTLPHLEGLLVTLADHGVYLVDPRTKRTQRVMPPLASPMIGSYDGSVLAGIERPSEVSLVDLPGRARWSIPALFQPLFLGDMSPSGKKMTTYVNGRSTIWTLPVIGPDLPAELARLTNATVDGDLLVWPWQHAVVAP